MSISLSTQERPAPVDRSVALRTHYDAAIESDAALHHALNAYEARALSTRKATPPPTRHVAPSLRPYRGLEHFLSLISPPRCALCDAHVSGVQDAICTTCETGVQWRRTQVDFGEVWSPFRHADHARRAVSRLKYHGERWRGVQLAQYAALSWLAAFEDTVDADDVLVPIPLTPRRIRTRGFNQAQVLIDGIRTRVDMRACTRTLWRQLDGQKDQKKLTREERLRRKNPFIARTTLQPNTRVWLVDDVVTTGATLQQAAERLQAAGLRPVGALTLTWTR